MFGVCIYFTQIISYTYTFLKNPGIPENKINQNHFKDIELNDLNKIDKNKRTKKNNNSYQFCNRCHLYIDVNKDISHCEDCNVCIEGKRKHYSYYCYLI